MRQLQQSSSDFVGSKGLGFLQILSGWLELLMQQKALQKDTAAAGTAGYSRDNPGSDFRQQRPWVSAGVAGQLAEDAG